MDFLFQHKSYKGKQSNATKKMKNINFVLEDIQRVLSSHKVSGMCNEREAFYIKICI